MMEETAANVDSSAGLKHLNLEHVGVGWTGINSSTF